VRAAVRSRSRPFAQSPCLQRLPSERANASEPERTPNLAILATEPAPNPDSIGRVLDIGEEELTVPVESAGIGECFERALHGGVEVEVGASLACVDELVPRATSAVPLVSPSSPPSNSGSKP
jgi:hypothetical protein